MMKCRGEAEYESKLDLGYGENNGRRYGAGGLYTQIKVGTE